MAAQTGPGISTIRSQANLVVVDVAVTDAAGHPVHNLRREDFALKEQGEPQRILSFEPHTAAPAPALIEPTPKLPPGSFTNYVATPPSGALDVLLVDSLNTPLDAQADLRRQLNDYLKKAPPGHRIAIFGLNARLYFLQGFTSDPAVLRDAVNRKPLQGSAVLANPLDNRPEQHLSDVISQEGSPDGLYTGTAGGGLGAGALSRFEADVEAFETTVRIRLTLNGLDSLAHYLSGLPGRKNLVWFSGAFPIRIGPDPSAVDGFRNSVELQALFQDTLNTLAQAQVAVYPIDARGLFNTPQYDPSVRGTTDPQQFSTQLQTFNQKTADEHATMERTAYDTGGRTFYNTNGLQQALATVIDTGDDYYTLTYAPSKPPERDIFHSIEVKLPQNAAKLSLAYRRGYFGTGVRSAEHRKLETSANATPAPSSTNLRIAMTHGAPVSTDLLLKAQVLPAVDAGQAADEGPGGTTKVEQDSPLLRGKWRRYVADVAVPPSQVLGEVTNGSAPAVVELVVFCFDTDGKIVSTASGTLRIHVPQANLQALQAQGLRMRQVISVPDRGEYSLRIGIHDLLTGRAGSLELPVSAVKLLPPAQ